MSDLTNQERAVFGSNAKRNPDGSVRERGIGAPAVHVATEAHDSVAVTRNLAVDLVGALKGLLAQAEAMVTSAQESMGLTATATAAHLAADAKALAPLPTTPILPAHTAAQIAADRLAADKAAADRKAAADKVAADKAAAEKAAREKELTA